LYKLMSKQKDRMNEIGDLGAPKTGGPWQLPKLPYLNPALATGADDLALGPLRQALKCPILISRKLRKSYFLGRRSYRAKLPDS
jgi:hypothetical protein